MDAFYLQAGLIEVGAAEPAATGPDVDDDEVADDDGTLDVPDMGPEEERSIGWTWVETKELQQRFLRGHAKREDQLVTLLGRLVDEQRKAVLAAIRSGWQGLSIRWDGWSPAKMAKDAKSNATILPAFDVEVETTRMVDSLTPVLVEMFVDELRRTWDQLGVDGPEPGAGQRGIRTRNLLTDVTDEAIEEWLQALGFKNVSSFNETTLKRIRSAMTQAAAQGGGLDSMVAAAERVYRGTSAFRLRTIARTELTGAMNSAFVSAAATSGKPVVKAWVTAGDEKVREAHLIAMVEHSDGIPLDQPFIVDDEPLFYPGDPTGEPGNIINCRCSQKLIWTI
jgi:hypothetical protein